MKRQLILIIIPFLFFSNFNLLGQIPELLPVPQNVTWGATKFPIEGAKIVVSHELLRREQNAIDQFIAFVKERTGLSITPTYNEVPDALLIVLKTEQEGQALAVPEDKSGKLSREAYKIHVTASKIEITANTDAGIFYALQTLRQLIVDQNTGSYIPEVVIEDYPSFVYRGVMMDFSHGGLLTVEEIKKQIDFLAHWKMNQYYFYSEVSIEMKGYPLINYNACYSQEQIKRIIAYARERHVDVIPFVNFYGHLHEMLRVEKYAGLGIGKYGHDLDPRNPEVQLFLKNWIKQYVDLFPSPFIHIGFDETWETERLTLEDPSIKPKELFLKQIHFVTKELQGYGKTVMVWTDISNNYPDIITDFPKGIIPVIWEYSYDPESFKNWLTPVAKEKLPLFVQSAVDSWQNVYPDEDYTCNNIDFCLKTCRDEKALGYITSVWTDAVQPLLRNTWLFMAYGSIGAWQKDAIKRDDFIESYCQIMYPSISRQMSIAFREMAESQSYLGNCIKRHNMLQSWADPFSAYHLKNTNAHFEEYKKARISAETAEENLIEALQAQTADSTFIKTLLVNSRMLDFTAARFIWAKTIVDRWNWLNILKVKGKTDKHRFYDINQASHGLIADMMDYCTEIKKEYKKAWLSENLPYRLETMLGRFDSEYLLWRNLYNKQLDYNKQDNDINTKLNFEDIFLHKIK